MKIFLQQGCILTAYLSLISFGIISNPAYAQSNDNCADAAILEVGSSCINSVFDNETATEEEGIAPEPSCGQYQGADVWFKVVVPASGALRIETNNHASGTEHSITMYSGTCGDFTELLCMQTDPDRTFHNPAIAGDTVYIQVFSFNGIAGSTFDICVWEPEISMNDNCANPIDLVAGQTCTLNEYSNAYATSEPINTAPDPTCGQYFGGDVWFTTTVPASGNLRIEPTT